MPVILRHKVEGFILLLLLTMVFLTYSPGDFTYFWLYWFTIFALFFFGALVDFLFCDQMSFLYDPNFANWQRKTDISL